MALRPYESGRQPAQAGRPADPFSMMDAMMSDMMMPFGGPCGGGRRATDPFGGGLFGGGLFQQMDQMMQMHMGGAQGGMMQMGQMGQMGGGGFSSQVMCFSSSVGADGNVHTERFSSSTVGDHSRAMHETQQAYSNSTSGVDKMSMERQIGDRGRKVVKERTRGSGEERHTDMFKGITEDQAEEFNDQWRQQAAPHLPQHPRMPTHASLGYRGGNTEPGYGGGYGGGHRAIAAAPATQAVPAAEYRRGSAPVQYGGAGYSSFSSAPRAPQLHEAPPQYQPSSGTMPSQSRRSPYY